MTEMQWRAVAEQAYHDLFDDSASLMVLVLRARGTLNRALYPHAVVFPKEGDTMMMGKFTGDIAPALFANPQGFQDAGLYLYGAANGAAAALGLGEVTWETTSVGEPGLSRVTMALYCDGHGYPLDRYTTAAALAHWLKGIKDGTDQNTGAFRQ